MRPYSRNAGGVVTEDEIARIRQSPFIPKKESVRGFVFDVSTGKLNEVS